MNQPDNKMPISHDATLDTSGLFCPLPVLRAKQALDKMSENSVLKLISTDPGSKNDIQTFTTQASYRLLESSCDGDTFVFLIQKTAV